MAIEDPKKSTLAGAGASSAEKPPVVEFVVTGDEVMRGTIADTNTAQTASLLYPLGLSLRRTVVVGDRGEDIRRALLEAAVRADFCIVSGGLGPTADDLTAECAAQAAGVPLRLDEAWLAHVRERWSARRREPMPANNERQALMPQTAELLGNPEGTAPAFALRIDRCTFFFLPGVPREYHRIVKEIVLPRLARATGHAALRTRVLQCYGISESALDEAVRPILEQHPEVRFGFRTRFPENHLSLAALAADEASAARNLARVEELCRARLGAYVFGADGVTYAQALGEELAARGATVATAESCTGGLVAQLLTEISGSSRYVRGGYVVYANELKQSAIGVPGDLIAAHGAVSEEVARAMAEGARRASGATYATSITGIAGPEGGSAEKPVGTVWLGLASPAGTRSTLSRFRGDRGQIRILAAYAALQLLRDELGAPSPRGAAGAPSAPASSSAT
jgi:nicotinamide-nucleotide amidase